MMGFVIPIEKMLEKCVFMKFGANDSVGFISKFPNTFGRD